VANTTDHRNKRWAFFSSGSKPDYLENIAQSLALPSGEIMQVRYDKTIVGNSFNDTAITSLIGNQGYLVYLDIGCASDNLSYIPVREVKIRDVKLVGSSFVVQLEMLCYVKFTESTEVDLRSLALEKLPQKDKSGCWVAELSSLLEHEVHFRHDFDGQNHLMAFESTVRQLLLHSDFGPKSNRRMFVNIIDLIDYNGRSVIRTSERILNAGKRYKLLVYHFGGDDDHWLPYSLSVSSESKDVIIHGESPIALGSAYDEKTVRFDFNRQAQKQAVGILVRLFCPSNTKADPELILTSIRLELTGYDNRLELIGRVVIMALSIALAQFLILSKGASSKGVESGVEANFLTYVFILLFALVSAWAAIFNFKKGP